MLVKERLQRLGERHFTFTPPLTAARRANYHRVKIHPRLKFGILDVTAVVLGDHVFNEQRLLAEDIAKDLLFLQRQGAVIFQAGIVDPNIVRIIYEGFPLMLPPFRQGLLKSRGFGCRGVLANLQSEIGKGADYAQGTDYLSACSDRFPVHGFDSLSHVRLV